ncbi:hypothetical protein POM88_052135 [Heracleum sosnowskyi]|uniref:RNase H type-1 domain-containing protein n=1 Tax=Heracleum sosnowskyi TaxID=360622 RepID=A0AAD8GTA7_9APIA|nr:hypothetical protein POM88_052135 [Heracleum sosnowskyi]
MENVNVRWRMPPKGKVKINIHGLFHEEVSAMGSRSGIGVVVRNIRGKILSMMAGSLGIEDRQNNEFQALMEGMKCSYFEGWENYYLESDHADAVCDTNCNELAIYLAEHGATNFDQMVVIEEPFGRIPHSWSLDMGLGSADIRFVAVYESDLRPQVINEEPVPEEVVDGV